MANVQTCPICNTQTLKLVIWKKLGSRSTSPVAKAMEQWGLTCVREWKCTKCGFEYKE